MNNMTRVMLTFLLSSNPDDDTRDHILGIRSPTTIIYDTPTPKHLIAIAASNNIEDAGFTTCANEKNDTFFKGPYLAIRDCNRRPIIEHSPQNSSINIAGTRPNGLKAYGIARIPAPQAVCNNVTTPDRAVDIPSLKLVGLLESTINDCG